MMKGPSNPIEKINTIYTLKLKYFCPFLIEDKYC